jgi:ketosteroid isomerase-like protein
MSELEDFKSEFLARQTVAEEALVHGDLAPRLRLWSRRDPLSLLGAARSATGWDDVHRIFRWVAEVLFGAGTKHGDFRFDVLVAEVSADGSMAYSVGFERFNQLLDDGTKAPMEVRVTHVYRKEQGEWKIVHRHGSLPPVAEDWPASSPS